MIQIDTNEEKERETGVDSEDMVALGINFGRAHAPRNLLLTGKLSKKGLRWLPVRGKCYSLLFCTYAHTVSTYQLSAPFLRWTGGGG